MQDMEVLPLTWGVSEVDAWKPDFVLGSDLCYDPSKPQSVLLNASHKYRKLSWLASWQEQVFPAKLDHLSLEIYIIA